MVCLFCNCACNCGSFIFLIYIGRKKVKIFKYIIQIIVDVFIGVFIKENGKPNWINIIGAFCLFCVIYAKVTN